MDVDDLRTRGGRAQRCGEGDRRHRCQGHPRSLRRDDRGGPQGAARGLSQYRHPINNAGGPPPGDFKDFSLEDWRKAVEGNMITPIALIHATVYGMMQRGFGRIVNITSQSVKAPIASLELSNGARLGLTVPWP